MISKKKAYELAQSVAEIGFTATQEKFRIAREDTLRRYLDWAEDMTVEDERLTVRDFADKAEGETNWREWATHLQDRQKLVKKSKSSQDRARVEIRTDLPFVIFKPMADMHFGSIGVNYERLMDFTDKLVACEYLFLGLIGDDTDNFGSFKSMMPVLNQIMTPEQQTDFLASWLAEIESHILFSAWGNHGEFEEKATGRNTTARTLSRKLPYFNGIGVCDLVVNDVDYKVVVTHKTRYASSFNKTHGLKQLARKDIPDADIYCSGHTHDPAYEHTFERGQWQTFVVVGSLKEEDTFAKRYFTYWAAQRDAAIVLDTRRRRVIPLPCVEDAIEFCEAALVRDGLNVKNPG